MSTTTNEYWMAYLRRHEAQECREFVKKQTIVETARCVVQMGEYEIEELKNLLLMCDGDVRKGILPIITIPAVQTVLYHLLTELKSVEAEGGHIGEKFSNRIKEDTVLNDFLVKATETLDSEPSAMVTYTSLGQLSREKPTLADARYNVARQTARTLHDIPSEEIAQRLSKGEIMPRNEWIPGQGKERRTLNRSDVQNHLDFGAQLHREGNEAFKSQQVDLALIRYTQGVQLLNWVEGEDEEDTHKINDLLIIFYRNQAAAALYLGDYRVVQEATTHALKLDNHDAKSLYRRAEAFVYLGQLPLAKNDYMAILRSPYSDTAAMQAAREGLGRIRSIVCKWKTTVKQFVPTAVNDVIFSTQRKSESEKNSSSVKDSHFPSRTRIPSIVKDTGWKSLCEVLFPTELFSTLQFQDSLKHPKMCEEDTKEILENILERYTQDDIQRELIRLSREADFDERRILIRTKPLLFSCLEQAIDPWSQLGTTLRDKQKELLMCIATYHKSEAINLLLKNIYRSVLGDNTDME